MLPPHGVAVLEISADRLTLSFVGVDRQTLYEYTLTPS
jgi:hypothetical protein